MQEWIKKEFNKELSIKTISYWCKKLGIKKKQIQISRKMRKK
jgi:hypothetical protein